MVPLLERTDLNATATLQLAMNHLAAARGHCRSGYAARAKDLYVYLDRTLGQLELWELSRGQ